MIAAAMLFNSGILLFADAEMDDRGEVQADSHTILSKHYGANSDGASSVFVVSEPGNRHTSEFHHCEEVLASIPPEDCTLERMREAVEKSLVDTDDEEVDFVALYSVKDQRYSLYRTTGTMLQEVVGYDCEGPVASLGHSVMHDRYIAARSMDTLDLTHVFSIATETLDVIRATYPECGKCSEMVVMYANGHLSDVQRMANESPKKRNAALTALGRS
jgi:hypothetical protein